MRARSGTRRASGRNLLDGTLPPRDPLNKDRAE
jgi:hypothetical protein